MATFDDKVWLLSHIQNSYVTSDDTGNSEKVDQGKLDKSLYVEFSCLAECDSFSCTSKEEEQSLDIPDMVYAKHRALSSAAQRIALLEIQKKSIAKVKRILWKHNPEASDSERQEVFVRKPIVTDAPSKSLLTKLLEEIQEGPKNPFSEYSKFDGKVHLSESSVKISVYVVLDPCNPPDYPVYVYLVLSAKVQDLIGLVCFVYTKEGRQPPLCTDVSCYSLFTAEDDGQIDWDFPPLPKRDLMEKYGFSTFGLVKTKEDSEDEKRISVTVYMADGAFSVVEVSSMDVTLKEILSRVSARRQEMTKMIERGLNYHLEPEDSPGITLNTDLTLADVKCTKFAVVRNNSSRSNFNVNNIYPVDVLLYKSFNVLWIHKLVKYKAYLGISVEKLEINTQKNTGFSLLRRPPQSVALNMKTLVDARIKTERKSYAEIQLTFRQEVKFKDYFLECERQMAGEILSKCKYIQFELGSVGHHRNVPKDKETESFTRHHSFSGKRYLHNNLFNDI